MASSKFLELQDYSDTDLAGELEGRRVQYQKMKFDHALTGLENPLDIREVRRDIARLQTEIRRRELATASKEDLAKRSKIRGRRRKK